MSFLEETVVFFRRDFSKTDRMGIVSVLERVLYYFFSGYLLFLEWALCYYGVFVHLSPCDGVATYPRCLFAFCLLTMELGSSTPKPLASINGSRMNCVILKLWDLWYF